MRKALVFCCLFVLLVSCTTTGIRSSSYVFQAMGEERAVVTVRSEKTAGRRVSFELDESGSVRGVIELDGIPKSVVKAALKQSGFEKRRSSFTTWYEDSSGLKVSFQKNGILVFSYTDIEMAVEDFVSNPVVRIDDETALRMAMMPYSVYVTDPKVLRSMAPFLSDFELENFTSLLLLSNDLESWDIEAVLRTQDLASTFMKLLKAKAVSEIIRSGNKPDIKELESLFSQTGNQVQAKNMKGFEVDLPQLGLINSYL